MYKVYLDNNIIVDIEEGNYSVEQFLNKNDYLYYFSKAHLEELLEAKDNPKVSQEKRLNLIAELCGKNHILTGVVDSPEFFDKEPREMFCITAYSRQFFHPANIDNQGNRSALKVRQVLGFNAKQLNNEPPDKILSIIDTRMKERVGIGLISYLKETEANNGSSIYHTLIQLINIANYWGDKETYHSNDARLYDAEHAYYAQICDMLVTNDKKMRMKIRAIYSFLGVNTKVISANEFLCN